MSLRPPGRFASTTSSAPPIPETSRCGEPKLDGRSSKPGPGHKQLRHTWNGTESGSVWTLHAPARPAVPPQQLPGALHGVADVEQPPDQRLEPAECPPLVIGEPVRQWAPPQLSLQPGPLLGRKPFPRDGPWGLQRRRPAVPPSRQARRRHPRTDPGVTRRSRDLPDPASGGEPPGRLQP